MLLIHFISFYSLFKITESLKKGLQPSLKFKLNNLIIRTYIYTPQMRANRLQIKQNLVNVNIKQLKPLLSPTDLSRQFLHKCQSK